MGVEDQLKQKLDDWGVHLTVAYVGAIDMDDWTFTLSRGRTQYSSHFHTGFDLRVKGKPVKPSDVLVIHSLLWESQAVKLSFVDWCASGGYSSESLSWLLMYIECRRTGNAMRNIFNPSELSLLEEILAEYLRHGK